LRSPPSGQRRTPRARPRPPEYGSFFRSFTLPSGASGERVSAEFKDGLLTVHLPKENPPAGKSVEVKAA